MVVERASLALAVGGVLGGAARGERYGPHQFQRLALERPDGVPVDGGGAVEDGLAQGPGADHERGGADGRVTVEVAELGDVLDAQVHRVAEAAGRGAVRGGVGGLARDGGHRGVQRVDLDEVGSGGAARPAGQLGQVAEVTHAPGAGGEHRVELEQQAVGAPLRGGEPVGGDEEVRVGGPPVGGVGAQQVAAERQAGAEAALVAVLGAYA